MPGATNRGSHPNKGEVKNLVIVPAQREVLPGSLRLNNRPSNPKEPLASWQAIFLPDGNIVRPVSTDDRRHSRYGFRLLQCSYVLCGTWMVVGYDPKRDRYRDVGFTAEDVGGMITWAPKFEGLMATATWKRLDTHFPIVSSGNERIRERDGAAVRAMESQGLLERYRDPYGAPRWSITDKGRSSTTSRPPRPFQFGKSDLPRVIKQTNKPIWRDDG